MHLDNWLFILLIAMAALLRLLASKATNAAKKNTTPRSEPTSAPSSNPPLTRRPVDTDEERIRRFLEALGQPTSSSPPPPVAPRPTYQKPVALPHVPPLPSPLPRLKTRPPDLPQEIQLLKPAVTIVPKATEATIFEVQEGLPARTPVSSSTEAYAIASQQAAQADQSETTILSLIGSPSAVRNAIILREIFGPPRGLQPLDLIGTA